MTSKALIPIADILEQYNIKFKSEIPERLKCIICKLILKNAKQTSCGCKVCEKCINIYLKDGEKPCPSNEPECAETKLKLSRDMNQDNATNREIANLKAQCPFPSCSTVESLRTIVTHIDSCEYREVTCDKCNKKYSFKNKAKHEKSECDNPLVICNHCQQSMTALIFNSTHLDEDHEDLCSKYVSDCSNKCGAKSVNIKSHMKGCTIKKVDCPFRHLGCTIGKLTTVKLTEHLQTESGSHFNSVISIIEKKINDNKALSDDVKLLQILLKEQMDNTRKLTDSQQKLKKNIEELEMLSPSAAAKVQENKVIFRNGSFIWKITDYEIEKCDAKKERWASVTSDPFYTSEFGYKMCLRIYPNGDGVGRYTHLSVFFAFMKGNFDDLLSWPFKQIVTLTLLDQENNGTKNHTERFKPDPQSVCYQKPIENCNNASGSPKFIELSSLFPSSAYYKNDTMFLKISVNTNGISMP